MIIGYARVSSKEQRLDLQIDALKQQQCDLIFSEKMSSGRERPELANALTHLRTGDTLVVWRLDRVGRSLKELVNIVSSLHDRKVHFKSLSDGIDTTTPTGRLQFGLLASLSQYEKELVRERTMAGLKAARKRGKRGGRPRGLSKEAKKKATLIGKLYADKSITIDDICRVAQVSKATCYRYLKHIGAKTNRQ